VTLYLVAADDAGAMIEALTPVRMSDIPKTGTSALCFLFIPIASFRVPIEMYFISID
jgi:hypothetical protein